jgi:hypothetical protein
MHGRRGVRVSQETVRLFVESWTNCWTLALGLGYVGRILYWPALASLCSEAAVRAMIFSSMAVVLVFCTQGFPPAGLFISGWAIGMTLIRKTVLTSE